MIEKNSLPSISVVMPTLNSATTLKYCLESILVQDYPQSLIEVLIVDGGSNDATLAIAKSFGCRIIQEEKERNNPEGRKAIGLKSAHNELVAFIDSDNILPHKEWFKKMVAPLLDSPEIIATQPLRYAYKSDASILNRYFALMGVNDPVAYYLNKRDRMSWAEDTWNLLGDSSERDGYLVVKFKSKNIPTLGANGFLIRREILLKSRCSPQEFFHIDVNCDLVALGYNTYGLVKEDIIHLTGNTFFSFLGKRMRYMRRYYQENNSARRYSVYTYEDKAKLVRFIFITLTLVKPFYDSFRGYRKIHDRAWFLHPLMCLGILFAYGWVTIEWWFVSNFRRFKKSLMRK